MLLVSSDLECLKSSSGLHAVSGSCTSCSAVHGHLAFCQLHLSVIPVLVVHAPTGHCLSILCIREVCSVKFQVEFDKLKVFMEHIFK